MLPLPIALTALLVASAAVAPVLATQATATWVDERFLSFPPLGDLPSSARRSFVYAADGQQLAVLHGPENREPVGLERVPSVLADAVVATEDREFWVHDGLDERAVARAAVRNLVAGTVVEGGSTITQQLVKQLMVGTEVTLERKFKEAAYAVELEERLTKEEILGLYLDTVYFGRGAYGVAAATELYFGHRVEETTLEEAATLAGLIRAPGANDPVRNPQAALERRNVVLRQMAEAGYIDAATADAAIATPLTLDITAPIVRFPFVVEWVKRQLLDDERLGVSREDRIRAVFGGGLRIHTTVDPDVQTAAEEAIGAVLTDPTRDPLAAVITLDPHTGQVRALAVGPKTFGVCPDGVTATCTSTKVNPAVPGQGGSGRQPGSSFKPFVLATALENGFRPSWATSTPSGVPIRGCLDGTGLWAPRNYSGRGAGTMDMYEAIRASNNVFHARLGAAVGPARVAAVAERLGISTEVPRGCSNALGAASVFPIDMAVAYGAFASEGLRCEPTIIARVEDADGRVLIDGTPSCERVLDPGIANTVTDMLRGVVTRGTGRRAQLPDRPVAGKTGTTNDFRDAWFVGYTPQLVTATWLGFEQPQPMVGILGFSRITGGSIPATIWARVMTAALDGEEVVGFTPPPRQLSPRRLDPGR